MNFTSSSQTTCSKPTRNLYFVSRKPVSSAIGHLSTSWIEDEPDARNNVGSPPKWGKALSWEQVLNRVCLLEWIKGLDFFLFWGPHEGWPVIRITFFFKLIQYENCFPCFPLWKDFWLTRVYFKLYFSLTWML